LITLVDANVLLDVFTADPRWRDWSKNHLRAALDVGEVALNSIIYAEVSLAFAHPQELDAELRRLDIAKLPLPYGAAFPAARAFARYRKDGGERRTPLPDIYIGAQAQVDGLVLLTRDARRYRTYFPEVNLSAPEA
jgi:predicted nucleic acid-binding protein